ncbi:MAG: AAA family ATPase, partial [Actinomycetes bacterium]
EINRASPKTQSALLEAMEERQITVDGATRRLDPPFMVIATQNPVDQEGTYRLPESQLDRFLLRIGLGYPGRAAEMSILDGRGAIDTLPKLAPVVSAPEVKGMIEVVRSVFMADALKAYLVDIAEASRRHPAIELGLSPRATLQLAAAARGHAAARGRRYATPDDVKVMAVPALAHRLLLRTDRGARLDPVDAVGEILADVVVPTTR